MSDDDEVAREKMYRTQLVLAKLLSVGAAGWFGFMAYAAVVAYDAGIVNPILPLWNCLFAACVVWLVVEVIRNRVWARTMLQGASLLTGLLTLVNATTTGNEILWGGVAVLAACGGMLHIAKHAFIARDRGGPPGFVVRGVLWAMVIGTIIVTVVPTGA